MQTNVSLEEELRKANATKGQLETYKRQVPHQQRSYRHTIMIFPLLYVGYTTLPNSSYTTLCEVHLSSFCAGG